MDAGRQRTGYRNGIADRFIIRICIAGCNRNTAVFRRIPAGPYIIAFSILGKLGLSGIRRKVNIAHTGSVHAFANRYRICLAHVVIKRCTELNRHNG